MDGAAPSPSPRAPGLTPFCAKTAHALDLDTCKAALAFVTGWRAWRPCRTGRLAASSGLQPAQGAPMWNRGGPSRKRRHGGVPGCTILTPTCRCYKAARALTRISNDCCFSTRELSAIADADARLLSLCSGRACHMGGFAPHTALRSRSNGHAVATWLTRHERRLLRPAFPVHRHHRCKDSGQ